MINIKYIKIWLLDKITNKTSVETINGTKIWHKNGKLHRDDGAAIEWADNLKHWYIEGQEYSEEEFNKIISGKKNKGNIMQEPKYEIKTFNDITEYYKDSKLHRLDGPAVEWSNVFKIWYQNGKTHRLDGPAIEWSNGDKYWYIEGQEYSEEEFNKKIKELI